MSSSPNNFFELLRKLRRAMGLAPPTAAEADAAMAKAEGFPMSEYEIRSIVDSVVSGKPAKRDLASDFGWTETLSSADAESEAYAMNRKRGELDDETKKQLDELRKEALEQHGDKDDEDRLADDGDKA